MRVAIVSCVYGKRFVPFIQTFLESLAQANIKADVLIGVHSIPKAELQLLEISYPKVKFVQLDLAQDKVSTHAAAASLKLAFWFRLMDLHIKVNQQVLFMDIDTLIISNPIFELNRVDTDDLVLTRKFGKWPLNSGVLFAKKNSRTTAFFQDWRDETLRIVNSKARNRIAETSSGGADQHALLELLNLQSSIRNFNSSGDSQNEYRLNIRFEECEKFNQTESTSLTPSTFVIHFKGGWHSIILDKGRYHKNRKKNPSIQFHRIWNSYYALSIKRIANSLNDFSSSQFNMVDFIGKTPYQSRDFLNSELALILGTLRCLGIRSVFESGMSQGHSIHIVSAILNDGRNYMFHSFERLSGIQDSQLKQKFGKDSITFLHQGNAISALPRLVRRTVKEDDSYAVLIHGLRSFNAIWLAVRLIRLPNSPKVIFIHDMKKNNEGNQPSLQRFVCQALFDRVFFSDDFAISTRLKQVDKTSISNTSSEETLGVRPYFKNSIFVGSYGTTLAAIIPSSRDLQLTQNFLKVPFNFMIHIYGTLLRGSIKSKI